MRKWSYNVFKCWTELLFPVIKIRTKSLIPKIRLKGGKKKVIYSIFSNIHYRNHPSSPICEEKNILKEGWLSAEDQSCWHLPNDLHKNPLTTTDGLRLLQNEDFFQMNCMIRLSSLKRFSWRFCLFIYNEGVCAYLRVWCVCGGFFSECRGIGIQYLENIICQYLEKYLTACQYSNFSYDFKTKFCIDMPVKLHLQDYHSTAEYYSSSMSYIL